MVDVNLARDLAIITFDYQYCSETSKSNLIVHDDTSLLTDDRQTCLLSNKFP